MIFRIIKAAGVLRPFENANIIVNVLEMVASDVDGLSGTITDELHVNKETIRQILHENLRNRKICAKIRRTRTHGREEATETRITQIWEEIFNFIKCIFLFPKVKNPPEEGSFTMLKILRQMSRPK
jgi:hypothetical protein